MAGEDEVDSSPTALQVRGLLPCAGQTAKRGRSSLPGSSKILHIGLPVILLPLNSSVTNVKGLKQHTRMKHKEVEIERMRKPSDRPPLSVSPIKDQSREEPCHNCGGEGSPGHQCEENLADQVCRPDRICDCSNPDCCTCVHDDSCQCFEDCEATAYCDCTIPYCVQLQT